MDGGAFFCFYRGFGMSNIIVKFQKAWRGYSAGEVAGFPQDQAEALKAANVAVMTDKKTVLAEGKAAAVKKAAPVAGTPNQEAIPPVDDGSASVDDVEDDDGKP
jgi:hypothetical protein